VNKKLKSLVEYFSESTASCLVMMVQGNIFSLSLFHLSIAAQTGLFAGITTFLMIYVTKLHSRWYIALLLGIITAVVDFAVHPGMFGNIVTEAIMTGVGAGVLSLILGFTVDFFLQSKNTK
jgi:hypothetical protein